MVERRSGNERNYFILIISTPRDLPVFEDLLGDGSAYGLELSYAVQEHPNGLAEAFLIGESFIGGDHVCLILGDNIFYGRHFSGVLQRSVLSIEEKPERPKSNYAVPGLYFYDNDVVSIAKSITPSARGELEITSVNNVYLQRGTLRVELLGRGMAWLDTGTHEGLLEAANYVSIMQKRQGLYVSCIEEIAFRMGYISRDELSALAEPMEKTKYGQYLRQIVEGVL